MASYTCKHCLMRFRVVERFHGQTEVSRCAELRCRRRMACGSSSHGPARLYVERRDVDADSLSRDTTGAG